MPDTIFALSSGSPPAAIGVIRISGPEAGSAVRSLAGHLPKPRSPSLRTLRDGAGAALDRALILWFPGPATATGEDLAELHCHGGRAVVAAILEGLAALDGLREAEPGEFTRRAFANGRIDLAEAEGLADLLAAETELQRRSALLSASGQLSRQVEDWRTRILGLASVVEAQIDFSDEDDVGTLPAAFGSELGELIHEMELMLAQPPAERLRDGVRVVFGGPPNAGKSSLFNAVLKENAAIVTPEAGTTRDVIERPVSIEGIPFVLVDTAGLRESGHGHIEAIGIERAHSQLAAADIVVWLGAEEDAPAGALLISAKADLHVDSESGGLPVSSVTGLGLPALVDALVARARLLLPSGDIAALNRRQNERARSAVEALLRIDLSGDFLIVAENLREARRQIDHLTGRDSTEEMLDALFGRFCIGK